MKQPPVRELLANYLRKRQDTVLRRLLALIAESPDLTEVHQMAHTREYQQTVTTLLDLMVQNIANPSDRRCFHYARQRALTRFQQNIQATQMLRIAALHRQVLAKMVNRQFAEDPALVRRMIEIIEEQIGEVELAFTDAYETARDRQWHISETKYFSLFENASEAIISFRPGQGQIIEANMQAERLSGRQRGDILRLHFSEIFAEEHREQANWLVQQTGGSSNIRLEDMAVRRADGMVVPISLSCNWVNVDGSSVAQVIMRDVTQLRQMQRELQSYAEQLEERVAARTHELQASEERYRSLFLQEQQRAQHLALINEVQQCALATRNIEDFLHQVTISIQAHFRSCDVIFYLCQGAANQNPAASFSGSESTPVSVSEALLKGPGALTLAQLSEGHKEFSNSAREGDSGVHEDSQGDPAAPIQVSECKELVVAAQVGGHGLSLPIGAKHPIELGLPGHAAIRGEMLYIANDAAQDERYMRPPGVHRDAGAEMCVPVRMEDEMIGVISVLCEDKSTFDPRDAVALQTAATIAAAHVQSSRMFQQMRDLKEFNETLVGTMLHSLMVVNHAGVIQIVNERLSQTLRLPRERLINQPLTTIFSQSTLEKHSIRDTLRDVTQTGFAREVPEVHVWTPEAEFIFDLRISRVYFRGEAQAVVLLINLTQRWRKTQQMQLVSEMGRLFQASLDINKVLYTVLTCITAGPALGFNRAFLLLLHEDSDTLKGAMALGPSSAEEAARIWRDLGQRQLSLQEILADESAFDPAHPTPLQQQTLALRINLQHPSFEVLRRAVHERRTSRVARDELIGPGLSTLSDEQHAASEAETILNLFTAPEIAIAPLASKDRIVGVVLADNLYSAAPIEDDDLRLLETVAQQAGLTIDNALTYQALQKAQKELVSAERLVAVGEMAARVSHEIRNPLATIGGFARSILKRLEDADIVRRKVEVIVDEVSRLEELLSDLLDMARPRQLDLQPHAINEIVEHALLLANADIKASGVEVKRELAHDMPLLMVDRRRLLQALLNTMRNGAQAMPEGGTLTVATRVRRIDGNVLRLEIEIRDSGLGIPTRALKQVFDPFFSTKIRGSGLGLAVTLRIIRDHGGDIDVYSEEREGTTFVMCLPLQLASSDGASSAETEESSSSAESGASLAGAAMSAGEVLNPQSPAGGD
jgi:PAS domain S-box-containing protein